MLFCPIKYFIKIPTHMISPKSIRSRLISLQLLPLQRRVRAACQRDFDVFETVLDMRHIQAMVSFKRRYVPILKEIAKFFSEHMQAVQLMKYSYCVLVFAMRMDCFWQSLALSIFNWYEATAH
jgi:hypothetical protein